MAKLNEIKQIVVGVDGSEHAAAALDWAIGLASRTGAHIVAVHALHLPPVYGVSGYEPLLPLDPEWQAEMKRLFEDEWCSPLRAAAVPFSRVFTEGRPASVIADAAERVDADLVVVGRRGRGSLTELLLGSVSHELSHHCKRPVVLISRQAAAGAESAAREATASGVASA